MWDMIGAIFDGANFFLDRNKKETPKVTVENSGSVKGDVNVTIVNDKGRLVIANQYDEFTVNIKGK